MGVGQTSKKQAYGAGIEGMKAPESPAAHTLAQAHADKSPDADRAVPEIQAGRLCRGYWFQSRLVTLLLSGLSLFLCRP